MAPYRPFHSSTNAEEPDERKQSLFLCGNGGTLQGNKFFPDGRPDASERREATVSLSHRVPIISLILTSNRSPLVRNCVRVLRLRPYFIQELLAGTPPNDDLAASLKSCFGFLENLTEYHLAWFELPFISNAAIDILRAPMLTSLFLQKLSIEASLPKLEILLSFEEKLPELKELIISVRRDRMGTGVDSEQTAPQLRSLASFLNRNRTTLTRFSFSSSDTLDSTPFFRSLLAFPLLAELSLSIPTSSPHLGTPSELARWMNRGCSASLQILTLKPHFIDDGHSQWQVSFGNWMISFASHLVLPKLNDLRLPSGFFQPQIISFVVSHFAMFSTLTSLDLTSQSMTFPQVRTIIQTSSSPSLCPSSNTLRHLRILRLGPITLSPELVDLLAEMLPELQELELRVKDVVPCKDEAPVYRSAWTTNTTEGTLTRKTRNQSRGQIVSIFFHEYTAKHPGLHFRTFGLFCIGTILHRDEIPDIPAMDLPATYFGVEIQFEAAVSEGVCGAS